MALLHRRGVKGYTTLNTLAFPGELTDLEATICNVATAGVDAVIVQDIGLARLICAIAPDLEIHASTQMSITSEEGVALARELGCTRSSWRANWRWVRSAGSAGRSTFRSRCSSTVRFASPIPDNA